MTDVVLDTDVVIGALDRQDTHHADAATVLGRLTDEGVALHLCAVNYAEALVRPAQETALLERATAAIAGLGIAVLAPDEAVARDAAALRGLSVSLADAFALATARSLDAQVWSFDARVLRAARAVGLEVPG